MRHVGITEIVVVGDRRDLLDVVRETWRPDAVLAWGEPYESPLWFGRDDGAAYVCESSVCQLPAKSPEELREQLSRSRHEP
jgi:hypothetical protein